MQRFLIFVSFFIYVSVFAQSRKSALFIGNSYTYVNDLPGMVHDIALTFTDTLIYDSNSPGGYTFQNHSSNATTLSKIKAQTWDFVILQGQSQEPSFPPAQVANATYPYAKMLCDSVRSNYGCSEVVFYMTWGRKNGDASNCGFYPPLCTYNGMQTRLRESYLHMADTNFATCAPVGMAWKKIIEDYPNMELYSPDESHPSLYGTYLTACVFYSTLFHKTSFGAFVPPGILPADAAILQTVASSVVLDSIDVWHLDSELPRAGFTYTQAGNQVNFSSTTSNADSLLWLFSDGFSISNATAPQHIFSGSTPSATLIAYNQCGSDTFTQTLTTVGIQNSQLLIEQLYSIYEADGFIIIEPKTTELFKANIFDIHGKRIAEIIYANSTLKIPLPGNGLYIVQIANAKNDQIFYKKLFVD